MLQARHMKRYPVRQPDRRDGDGPARPVTPREADPLRAAWASEALAAEWPDGGPCADRLALLDLCNPRAGWRRAAAGPHRPALRRHDQGILPRSLVPL